MNKTLAIVSLTLAAAAPGQEPAAQSTEEPVRLWNQWRGPDRTGRVTGVVWPDRLNKDNLKRRWRVPLGPSYSGPVVSRDLVFTTATEDEEKEVVTSPESFQVIDRMPVADRETWGHLAVDGGQILIRELDALTAFSWN